VLAGLKIETKRGYAIRFKGGPHPMDGGQFFELQINMMSFVF
jgi:hypothetical protein